MKTSVAVLSTFAVMLMASVSNAQFDFGKVFKGEAKRIIRNVENDVRNHIKNELRIPRYETLPYEPPVKPLPVLPPVCPDPVVITPTPAPQPKPAPKPQPKKLPEVQLGSVVPITGKGFGTEPGDVFIKIDSLILAAELLEWKDTQTKVKLPRLPILEAAQASIFVLNAKEDIAKQMDVVILPPSEEDETAEEEVAEEEAAAPMVHPSQEVTLEGELGEKQGRVEIRIGVLKLEAKVSAWSTSETTVKLPEFKTVEPHPATIVVMRADGKVIEQIEVQYSGHPE